ncbi:hypothetical protein DFJ43DRAFT_410408 [Lentinula guzmanii]|uniref:Uncharacterized protein n=1 Tax=Lentinula guzmanii TaxID=2804957 RepID=A0AA38MT76_9AGAR|nr:hypothetical protein DFJ43DRAFT_410408 [Lentinula guzmanii]
MHTTPFLRNISRTTSLTPSAALLERVKRPAYLQRLARPEDLVPMFKHDDYVGILNAFGMFIDLQK